MFLVRRVGRLLAMPRAEWTVIAAERDEVAAICQSYVCVLALVPAGAPLVGLAAVARYLGAAAISTAIMAAMVTWILAIGGSIAAAVVIEKAAPLFDGDGGLTESFKLVAYSYTPFWLSGAFYAFDPRTPIVAAGALWGAWLLYLGAPCVMKVPRTRTIPFTAAALAALAGAHVGLRAVFSAFRVPYLGY